MPIYEDSLYKAYIWWLPYYEWLLIWWWWAGGRSCCSRTWWWGWAWWVVYCESDGSLTWSYCIVIWAWGTASLTECSWECLSWWDSCFWSIVAYWGWWWGWMSAVSAWTAGASWGSWWWNSWCTTAAEPLWCLWQWNKWGCACTYRWWWGGWYSTAWCKSTSIACWWKWWEWLCSNISGEYIWYASWGGWGWCCWGTSCWGWTWWCFWNNWCDATCYWSGWGWGWRCNSCISLKWWNGCQWVFYITYPNKSAYCVTWWQCCYLCNWKCIHVFTSNWTLTVNYLQ